MSEAPSEMTFLEILDPDVVVLRPGARHGTGDGVADIGDALGKRAERGRFFLVIDFSSYRSGIDAETRERGLRLVKTEWLLGAIYINASTPIRVALKVLALVSGNTFPTAHVGSREEAMTSLEEMRRSLADRR